MSKLTRQMSLKVAGNGSQRSARCGHREAMDHVAKGIKMETMPYMDQFFQLAYGKNAGARDATRGSDLIGG